MVDVQRRGTSIPEIFFHPYLELEIFHGVRVVQLGVLRGESTGLPLWYLAGPQMAHG